jgi:predicted O-linked N-acetylglucosamine transferase (SPINDLY family)
MSGAPIQLLFQQAMALHRGGRLEEAERAYRQIGKVDPRDYPSRCMLARLYLDQGRNGEAEKVADAAVKLDGRAIPGLSTYGLALLRGGKFRPAAAILERAIAADPRDWSLRSNLGDALFGLGQTPQAMAAYDAALALEPLAAEVWSRRAAALLALGKPEEALADCARAPRDPQALAVRAEALTVLERTDEAIAAFGEAIAAAPADTSLLLDRARLLLEAGRAETAIADCTAALQRDPNRFEALRLRSTALARLRHAEAALADSLAAAALAPRDPESHFLRALRLEDLGRLAEATVAYDQALALGDRKRPDLRALNNRSAALIELGRYGEALEGLKRILAIEPHHAFAFGAYAHALRLTCDWTDLERVEADLRDVIEGDRADVAPGTVVAYFDDPALQLTAARNHARRVMPSLSARPPVKAHERLRIAYLSADFHSHATLRLAIELFERHDRSRFEITAVSFGPDDGSAMRARAVAAFEHFHDARTMSDEAVVALLREREIDIAVDLKGFTAGSREGVFARGAAPVQVSYLGFPGALGSQAFDYILADATTAPLAMQPVFTEAIVQLPGSYQPNDSSRPRPPAPTRAEAGLADGAFVFCCFNNSYKITPQLFDIWMRLLAATPGAVLWLLEDNAPAVANLRQAAAARGVDPARLIFAPRVSPEDHLARQPLADLFLDTLPYGAHTTASDALWMGLPVVTCLGQAFAGRVGASLCRAAGLEDLVTADLAAYEALALSLAADPQRLTAIRAGLVAERVSLPLFDADAHRRGVEAAFEAMQARALTGEPPVAFAV